MVDRIGETQAGDGKNQEYLSHEQPSASATEVRQSKTIQKRCPNKLQCIGKTHQSHHSDDGQVHPFFFHPGLQYR